MFNAGMDLIILGMVFNAYLLGIIIRMWLLDSSHSIVKKIFYIPMEIYLFIKNYKTNRLNKLETILAIANLIVCIYINISLSYYDILSYYDMYTDFSYYLIQTLVFIVFYNIAILEFYFIRRVK